MGSGAGIILIELRGGGSIYSDCDVKGFEERLLKGLSNLLLNVVLASNKIGMYQ